MPFDSSHKPRLRPLEAFRVAGDDGLQIALRDPSRLSDVVLSMSAPALHLLSLMDGENTIGDVRSEFQKAHGQGVSPDTITKLLDHLERAHFLEGDSFEEWYADLVNEFRSRGVREMPSAASLGISDTSGSLFEAILSQTEPPRFNGDVRGLIAPHLDYPRGSPCYAAAYGALRGRAAPDRVVILGTNHFGRSRSVVATASDFVTPLGRTKADAAFIEGLEARCGDLRRFEFDHVREHSVELQVAFLQHLFGADRFTIVPVLCPDPCGPTGTAPADGAGVDLRAFSEALAEQIAADSKDTLVIAGADLSHVGENFGDTRPLDDAFLEEVRRRDRQGLDWLEINDPASFVRTLAQDDNPTRVCSAGCLFALRTALPTATAVILRYHQAVDRDTQTCVTCAAAVFT